VDDGRQIHFLIEEQKLTTHPSPLIAHLLFVKKQEKGILG
jgi:hypothetical protein